MNIFILASLSNIVMVFYIEFMVRRELISNKIEKFDDYLENFYFWKGFFYNMIKGVNFSFSE